MAAREITNLRSGSAGTVDAPAENYAHPPFDRDHIVSYVGISHLSERHSGSAPKVDFRPQLRAGHAGSVCGLKPNSERYAAS